MSKQQIYLLSFFFVCLAFALNFASSHNKVPIGCDEYGYLYLSEAMSQGNTFTEHTERLYLKPLLQAFDSNQIFRGAYSYMVAPLAYYLRDDSNEIINMYHPGTSWLLHFISLDYRKYAFPLMVILLLAPLFYLIQKANQKFTLSDILLLCLILLMFLPFSVIRTEFTRINSLAPTFGFLLLAGYFLNRNPILSVFLIGLSANFRFGNVLLVWPIIALLIYQNLSADKKLKSMLIKLILLGCALLFALSPYFYYVTQLLGSPIKSTYSSIDTKFSGTPINLGFYLQLSSQWLWLHLIGIFILIKLYIKNLLGIEVLITLLAIVVFNYAFYSFKQITMNYYPYASFFILFGTILQAAKSFELKDSYKKPFKYLFLGLFTALVFAGSIEFTKHDRPTFQVAKEKYVALKPYQIVWCDLLSGTTEYACGNSGFMFNRGTSGARKVAYQFFYEHDYSQVFVLNDLPIAPEAIVKELKEIKIPFRVEQSSLGLLIIVNNGF